MSNALATIIFPDGTKMYIQFQGCSDSIYDALFDSASEAMHLSRHDDKDWKLLTRTERLKEPQDVIVVSYYGGREEFKGKACKVTKQLRVEYPRWWVGD